MGGFDGWLQLKLAELLYCLFVPDLSSELAILPSVSACFISPFLPPVDRRKRGDGPVRLCPSAAH